MLNISSSSWHYRLRAKFFNSPPKDLCSYFWSVVGAILIVAAGGVATFLHWAFVDKNGKTRRVIPVIAVGLAVALLLALTGVIIYRLIIDPWAFLIALLKGGGLTLAIIAGAILFLVIIGGIGEAHKHYRKSHPIKPSESKVVAEVQPDGESTFSLVWNFLKSKKRKVCPLISVDGKTHIRSAEDLKTVLEDFNRRQVR